jgi:plasmid maintenance system antidote protein VapI
MASRLQDITTLRQLLAARGLTMDETGVLARVDTATISRICSGQARATPKTVVRLGRALGINARRMERLCDAAWREREPRGDAETVPGETVPAETVPGETDHGGGDRGAVARRPGRHDDLRRIDIDAMSGEGASSR